MDKAKKTFTINVLRRGSYKWPGRWLAEKRSALGGGYYYCENPECGLIVKKKETQMDHILPVIPMDKGTEKTSLDEIADRMYCSPEGFARLCIPCHSEKTNREGIIRMDNRYAKKNTTK
jgi:hypothetical protein